MYRIFAVFAMLFFATAAAAQGTYRLQSGDVLRIEVLEDATLNRQEFVLPDGSINFPLVGTLDVGGRTVSQVRSALTTALAPNFAAPPTVFVTVVGLGGDAEQIELIDVYVAGEANAPGKRQIEEGTRILQFLAESGGFTRFAATKRLQLRRTDSTGRERIFIIDYRAIERGNAVVTNFTLQEGDVLVVPQRRLFE